MGRCGANRRAFALVGLGALLAGCFASSDKHGEPAPDAAATVGAGDGDASSPSASDVTPDDAGTRTAPPSGDDASTPGVCVEDADCPPSTSMCLRVACLDGTCTDIKRAAGTVLDDSVQQEGDCVRLVCDGDGAITEQLDEDDVPEATEPCSAPRCTSAGVVLDPLPADTIIGANDGDCRRIVCDGAGGMHDEADPDDTPRGPSDPCVTRSCEDGDFVYTPVPQGGRCGQDQVCDENGDCVTCGVAGSPSCPNIAFDAIDMLFVVDSSGTMREEQDALREQFPRLIEILTTGDRDLDGAQDFPVVTDLHLGVVSADMGLLGISGIPGCEGFGDDGILQHAPNATLLGCQTSYPTFLTYTAGLQTPTALATDFGCISTLGTEGCGFEQQLESALKALWPSANDDVSFLADAMGQGTRGHGDVENAGFLRDDPTDPSLLAVVVVSDENDCSAADTVLFTPDVYLDPNDPAQAALANQDLNLRCHYNPQDLYPVSRYVDGLRSLRPNLDRHVIFTAIVGVPEDLVAPSALAAVDFASPAERDAFYDGLLDDPRMEEVPDATLPPGNGNLIPVCDTDDRLAYPGRRFVEVARAFGQQGLVQSICQSDFAPAMDAIIDAIVARR